MTTTLPAYPIPKLDLTDEKPAAVAALLKALPWR
jgi:hypothetical protein